jgi:DNA (cytosine-5)-methyltransferase 1
MKFDRGDSQHLDRLADQPVQMLAVPICMAHGQASAEIGIGIGTTLNCNHEAPILCQETAHTLRGEGFDASEDGTGGGTPLVVAATAFSCKDYGADAGEVAPTLRSMGHDKSHANGGGQLAIAFNLRGRDGGAMAEMAEMAEMASLRAASGGSSRSYIAGSTVRRITPRECERLQGFPDDFTLIPISRGKKVKWSANGPRYKALGNSMAVPVIRWLGERIEMVDAL